LCIFRLNVSDAEAIARIDGQPMGFAGLWDGFKRPDGMETRTFTIVTTNANETVGETVRRCGRAS